MNAPAPRSSAVVRRARKEDAAAIAELSGQLGYPSTKEQVERRLVHVLADSAHTLFVAEMTGGHIGGWLHVFGYHVVESDPRAEVGGLVVDEAQRGAGIGRLLMQNAENWAREKGYAAVGLRSNIVRHDAHAFYQRIGYKIPKTQHVFRKELQMPRPTSTPGAPETKLHCDEVLHKMASLGSARGIAMMKHFRISGVKAFGLSAPKLHRLAKEIGRDHALAEELWRTGIHDAHHLAALVDQPELVTEEQMERWALDFNSWDVVDTCCRYLFLYTPFAWKKTSEWSRRKEEFVKRAAFSQMAYLAQHDKRAADSEFICLLPILRREATDERNFVRKAVNWALRQIGKRNLALNRRAIAACKRIRALNTRAARWIAADALRELQSDAVQRRLRVRQHAAASQRSTR